VSITRNAYTQPENKMRVSLGVPYELQQQKITTTTTTTTTIM
jgi:hypothetical protein